MSIASEITRLQQAKSDLATSIANKGVTVPAATTIDGYATLVDQIQTGSPLPYDARIEYLRCSGTQYINTGIKGSSDIKIRLRCLYQICTSSSSTSYGWIFGSRVAASNKAYNLVHTYSGNFRFGSGTATNWANSATRIVTFDNTESTNVMKVYDASNTLIATMTASSATFNNNLDLYLFGNNTNGTAGLGSDITIYSCEFYNGSTKIAEFIPVRVGQVGCMYDKVSGSFFYNQGTGSFVLGPDVV